jgi:hypothetical protein
MAFGKEFEGIGVRSWVLGLKFLARKCGGEDCLFTVGMREKRENDAGATQK